MDPVIQAVILTFIITTIFWLMIKLTFYVRRCHNYKKDFEKGFQIYIKKKLIQMPQAHMSQSTIKMGYRAGYYQAFFKKCI